MRLVHYCREFWSDEERRVGLGETYYCYIFGDAEAEGLDCIEGGISYYVVECEYGVGTVVALQHLYGYVACVVEIDVAVDDDGAVYLDATFAQRFQVAVFAAFHHV